MQTHSNPSDAPAIDQAAVIARLKTHEQTLRTAGISRIAVFHAALQDDHFNSDETGLLLEADPTAPVSAYAYFALERQIEAWLGWRIPMIDPTLLRSDVREAVLRDAQPVF